MQNLNKTAINNGFVIAAVGIAIQLLLYYAAPNLLGSFVTGIVIWIILLVLYIIFTLDIRKKIGGFWSFKDALKGIFLMSLIANVSSSIFNFLFYKFVEPGAYDKVSGIITESTTSTLEKMGMSQDQIDKGIEGALKSLKAQYQPSLLDFLKNIAIAILIGFVMSLIFAAIFKKNPPMFVPVDETD